MTESKFTDTLGQPFVDGTVIRFALLLAMLLSAGTHKIRAHSQESVSETTVAENPSTPDEAAVIRDVQQLNALEAQKTPVTFAIQGKLIWRNEFGHLRLDCGTTYKAFRLRGNLDELKKCSLGDLVEVSGREIPNPAMWAGETKLLKPWDGKKLRYVSGFKSKRMMLWRYVQYTGVVSEILHTPNGCRMMVGPNVQVTMNAIVSREQLASWLGKTIRVRGASFKHPQQKKADAPSFLYIGVLDPDRQVVIQEQAIPDVPVPEHDLVLRDTIVDHIGKRYVATSGYGISTALSGHLEPGDVLDIQAGRLNVQNRDAQSIWITLKSTGAEPATPQLITNRNVLDQHYLNRIVSIRGTVEHCFTTQRGIELMVSDGPRTFLVNMPLPAERRQVDQYERGAVVNVAGVVRSIAQGSSAAIVLDAASAEDLVISESPMRLRSWLVKSLAAGVLVAALLLVFCSWILKRQVRRKTAELKTSTSRMMAASSAVRDGLLIFDATSQVTFVSEKVLATLGVSLPVGVSESSTRRCLQQLICETEAFETSWNGVFRNPLNTFEGEFSLRESGRRVFAYSAPVYNAAGRADGRIWTFEDITQRRQLEDETLQSRKLSAIGQLAGGVAHDFNNLLQIIGSNLQLLQRPTPADWPEHEETPLESASSAVQRGADLTRQLLTFARTSKVQITPTNVNQLLEQTVSMLDRTLGDHIRLSVSLSTDLPAAEIDSGQLEQVLINMCLNSGEAIGLNNGFIRVATKAAEHKQIGSSILISIEDNGCGMSPEVLNRVFEPFFTTKDVERGTGLGLATAFGAIKQMQGRIECSSVVGEGTCFRIYLPASVAAVCAPAEPIPTAPRDTTVAIPCRVLLVDDDARILRSVNHLLTCLGHKVICAGGGIEAIAKLRREPIDVVMLDLSMPEMPGWQVLQQIREEHSNVKVIVCSGYSHDAEKMMASDIEPDAFLNKPFQLDQLSTAFASLAR